MSQHNSQHNYSQLPLINAPFGMYNTNATSNITSNTHNQRTQYINSSPAPRRHITFVSSQPHQLISKRNDYINNIYNLIQRLYVPVELMIQTYLEYKNNYIQWMMKQNFSKQAIDDELNECLILIMRKLYFSTPTLSSMQPSISPR